MKDLVYGIHSVREAIQAGKSIDKVIIQKNSSEVLQEIKKIARSYQIPTQEVPITAINRLCPQKNHQGIVAYLSLIEYQPLDEIVTRTFENGENPFLIMLDGITDVRNIGAIARSAECMGVHALILPTSGSARINQDTMKTSSGALNYLPVCKENNLRNTILTLKSFGINILACSEKGTKKIYEYNLNQPICWVLGDEHKGISSQLLKLCDDVLAIPMCGHIESLNVSVAAGIICYETVKQKNCK